MNNPFKSQSFLKNERSMCSILMSFAFVINIYIVYASSFLILLYWTIKHRKVEFDLGDVLIILAMLSWKGFAGYGLFSVIIDSLGFWAIYHVGKINVMSSSKTRILFSKHAVFLLGYCLFLKGLVNYSYLLRHLSMANTDLWPNWRGEVLPRTHYEFFLVIIASLLVYFILKLIDNRNIYLWGGILCSVLAIFMGIYSEGRIAFFCMLCTSIIVGGAYVVENKSYKTRAFKFTFAICMLIVFTGSVLFANNSYGLYDAYESSMWSGSGGIIHNTRFTIQLDSIKQLLEYPFGKNNTYLVEYNGVKTLYAHNTWLDIGREGGIIPLILTVGFSFYNVICCIGLWRNSLDVNKYAIMAAFIAISLYNCVEPAFVSDPMFWGVEIYLGGILSSVISVHLPIERNYI